MTAPEAIKHLREWQAREIALRFPDSAKLYGEIADLIEQLSTDNDRMKSLLPNEQHDRVLTRRFGDPGYDD